MTQAILNFPVRLIDFLIRQRAVCGLIRQGESETFATGGDVVAAIEVEQAGVAQ